MVITLIILAVFISRYRTVHTANTTLPTEIKGVLQKYETSQPTLDEELSMIFSQSKPMSNGSQTMDMKHFAYLCVVLVAREETSTKTFVLTKHCLIPKESFIALSNHVKIWKFLQENCSNWDIKREKVIKYASYYNVDEKTCMSVPADGIPVKVKTGTTESLCNIPVDVNGKGMFTIDAHVLSSWCSPNFDINKLFENEKFKISPFQELQKLYRNPNIKADLFNIRFCKLMYGETDGNGKISAKTTGYDCLASVKTGQLLRYYLISPKFVTRRCPMDYSAVAVKYIPMVPSSTCEKTIQASVCKVSIT